MLPRLHVDSFDWSTWRNCDVELMFGCQCRTDQIVKNKKIFRQHAIGYIEAERLICRPKNKNKAVLFFNNDTYCWFHMTDREFEEVFDN